MIDDTSEELTIIPKEQMDKAAEEFLRKCKNSSITPDYKNALELELSFEELEENLDKIDLIKKTGVYKLTFFNN